jgi:hypothetical protein
MIERWGLRRRRGHISNNNERALMNSGRPFGVMEGRHSRIINLLSGDITSMLEFDNSAPPVMFKSRTELAQWAASLDLKEKKIGRFSENNAIVFYGTISGSVENFGYAQIWVRASYKNYAKVLHAVGVKHYKHKPDELIGLDADHVINRARISHLREAWVSLFPVYQGANRSFGARIEKYFLQPNESTARMDLPPLVALKLLCVDMPKTMEELQVVMEENIRKRILQDRKFGKEYCDQMEKDAAEYMKNSP